MKFEERVNKFSDFTNTEKKIMKYIINNKSKVIKLSITNLSTETFTSPPTITRLSKKLGYKGFKELKYSLEKDLRTNNISQNASDNFTLFKKDIDETLAYIERKDFSGIVDVFNNSSTIYLYGTSWGERIASEIFFRNLLTIDVNIINIPSITELWWIYDKIEENSLVMIISYSGKNKELLDIVNKLNLKKVSLISVTPFSENKLSQYSKFNLYYSSREIKESYFKSNREYNVFTTLHIVLDALYRKILDGLY